MPNNNIAIGMDNLTLIIEDPNILAAIDKEAIEAACLILSDSLKRHAFKPIVPCPPPLEPLAPPKSKPSKEDIKRTISALLNADTDDFWELQKIANAAPAEDYKWSDLLQVDFGGKDLSGYDLTGSLIYPPSFKNAKIDKTRFDETQRQAFEYFSMPILQSNPQETEPVLTRNTLKIIARKSFPCNFSLISQQAHDPSRDKTFHGCISGGQGFLETPILEHLEATTKFNACNDPNARNELNEERLKTQNTLAFKIIAENDYPTSGNNMYQSIHYETACALAEVLSVYTQGRISGLNANI